MTSDLIKSAMSLEDLFVGALVSILLVPVLPAKFVNTMVNSFDSLLLASVGILVFMFLITYITNASMTITIIGAVTLVVVSFITLLCVIWRGKSERDAMRSIRRWHRLGLGRKWRKVNLESYRLARSVLTEKFDPNSLLSESESDAILRVFASRHPEYALVRSRNRRDQLRGQATIFLLVFGIVYLLCWSPNSYSPDFVELLGAPLVFVGTTLFTLRVIKVLLNNSAAGAEQFRLSVVEIMSTKPMELNSISAKVSKQSVYRAMLVSSSRRSQV